MQKRKSYADILPYAGIWLAFAGMFFFIVPQSDVLLFAHDPRTGVSGALEAAYTYGNGRLLGNWVGMFFSHRFVWAFLPIACCLTGIVWLVNRLVFDGDRKAILPIACLLAFPSARMAEECYFLFAAFANYVLPIFCILLSVYLKRVLSAKRLHSLTRAALFVLTILCAAAGALCSENTTIVLLTLAVLFAASDVRRARRVSAGSVVFLLGAISGGAGMVCVPILSGSAHKMDAYRGVAGGGVLSLLGNAASAFVQFSGIVLSLTGAVALLSAAFLLLLRGKGNRPAYTFARVVFAVCPALSLALTALNVSFVYAAVAQLACTALFVLFAAAVWIGISAIGDKRMRENAWGFFALLFVSAAPLMFVTQHGYRTYYATFILLLVWALQLLRAQQDVWLPLLRRLRLRAVPCTAALACAFVLFCGFAGVQTMLNFNVFAVRTAIIAQAVEDGREEITVPYLPCYALSVEENWPNKISDVLPDKSVLRIVERSDVSA